MDFIIDMISATYLINQWYDTEKQEKALCHEGIWVLEKPLTLVKKQDIK